MEIQKEKGLHISIKMLYLGEVMSTWDAAIVINVIMLRGMKIKLVVSPSERAVHGPHL